MQSVINGADNPYTTSLPLYRDLKFKFKIPALYKELESEILHPCWNELLALN